MPKIRKKKSDLEGFEAFESLAPKIRKTTPPRTSDLEGFESFRSVHPLTVQTLLMYSPVGFDLKQVQRARENALKLLAEAIELSPRLDHFRESFRALFASLGSSPRGLYSKRFCTVWG